ncbi:MAG: N-acetyltransferase [Alphaproteobacteria bacterium]|nr:MAG: N-acetyltransferase [Alphaproteobacteria bacterium]
MITFDQERAFDSAQVETLLDVAFGPDRFSKSSYSLRENVAPLTHLSWVARHEGRLVGTVRFWPIHVQDMIRGTKEQALLLGPLAVAPDMQSHGIGGDLMRRALARANASGHDRILLVGDHAYYSRFGFEHVLPRYITMPGGKDARRLLVRQPATMASLPAVGKIVSVADALPVPAAVAVPRAPALPLCA